MTIKMGNCSLGMCGGLQAGRFWQKKNLNPEIKIRHDLMLFLWKLNILFEFRAPKYLAFDTLLIVFVAFLFFFFFGGGGGVLNCLGSRLIRTFSVMLSSNQESLFQCLPPLSLVIILNS